MTDNTEAGPRDLPAMELSWLRSKEAADVAFEEHRKVMKGSGLSWAVFTVWVAANKAADNAFDAYINARQSAGN